MRRPPLTALVSLACLAAAAGCGGERVAPAPPGAPAVIASACERAAARAAFAVLCPARWPAAAGSEAPGARLFVQDKEAYLVNADHGFARRGGHVFHLLFGGQREPFGRWPAGVDPRLRLTTRHVTVPIRGGGTFVQQRPARALATARVHGIPAQVVVEPPYPQGGLHGGHVVVLWTERGHGYLVSVHGERMSRRALVAIAVDLAESSRGAD